MPDESALSLVERLRAALDRAEEIARAAMVATTWDGREHRPRTTDGKWTANGCYVEGDGIEIYDEGGHNTDQAAFIAAHDPAHVLRTIQAHRKILDRHVPLEDGAALKLGFEGMPPICGGCWTTWAECPDLAALASIYFPEAPDGT